MKIDISQEILKNKPQLNADECRFLSVIRTEIGEDLFRAPISNYPTQSQLYIPCHSIIHQNVYNID